MGKPAICIEIRMKELAVVMSTYNGEKYIEEQIKSLLNQQQKSFKMHIYVRDDGSTDRTRQLLNKYAKKYKELFTVSYGKNIGFIKSFIEALKMTKEEAYYAFCDQDDVWKNDKLIAAVRLIHKAENKGSIPTLYYSNAELVDSGLNKAGMLRDDNWPCYKKKITAICYPFAFGCTTVFNKKLKDYIFMYKPKYLHEHDYWISMVALYTGRVIYDKNSHILYRRHDSNFTKLTLCRSLKVKLNELKKKNYYSRTAEDLLNGYKKYISKGDREDLLLFCEYKTDIVKKLLLFFSPYILKKRFLGTLSLKFMILFSHF